MRTAFQLWPALDHRSTASRISSVAVTESGNTLYLGLSDGQVEEHSIACTQHGVRTSLRARKHFGKKPIQSICHLYSAQRLAILCDGQLQLADQELVDARSIPNVKAVSAIALNPWAQYPPRIAVAMRTNKRNARIMVFEIQSAADSGSPFGVSALCIHQMNVAESLTIKSMAWLGQQLVLCTSLRYILLHPAQQTSTQLFALAAEAPSPTMVQSVPAANLALLLMDEIGVLLHDSGHPAQSALTFPSTPIALAASGLYILAACLDGIHVYDRTSGAWVQSLPYPAGVTPSPGQTVVTAYNNKGNCVLFAGQQKVMLFQPIALEQQAKDLLKEGQYEQALALANVCAVHGAPWVETAFAQAALLLLNELKFDEAMSNLMHSSLSLFQPIELFPLFPDVTAPWADQIPTKQYWGLHQPLAPLQSLLAREEQAQARTLLEQDAMQSIAGYLLQVREQDGIDVADGVDTLLVYLLAELEDAPRLTGLAEGPQQAAPALLADLLQRKGQSDTLAQLYAGAGQPAAGLALWKDIADENQGRKGEGLMRQQSAVQHATAVLLNKQAAPAPLVLTYLPWLIAASPFHALNVLKVRNIDQEIALKLVRSPEASPDLLWRYLDYLVCQQGNAQPELHTELAVQLADAALRGLLPEDKDRQQPNTGAHAQATGADIRSKLQSFLQQSSRYDAELLLTHVHDSALWEEQVVLHSKVGNDAAALRILVLELQDILAAEQYCAQRNSKQDGGQSCHMQLLDLLLHPGAGRQPMYTQACHLLGSQGADLDPMQVLLALPDDMPLSAGADILARMVCERIHRHRHGSIIRSLQRSVHLSTTAQRVELQSRRVVTTEERACAMCHTRIGTKIFAMYPDGTLVCYKCHKKSPSHVSPVNSRDFRTSPASSADVWPD